MKLDGTVHLRNWDVSDIDPLLTLRNDHPLQRQLLAHPKQHTRATVRRWLQKKSDERGLVFFVIADLRTNQTLGYLQYGGVDDIDRTAELGIVLVSAARGGGRGGEAMLLGEQYLRTIHRVRKVWLRVRADNLTAIRSYKKVGFCRCGSLTRHVVDTGVEHDVVMMEKFLGE